MTMSDNSPESVELDRFEARYFGTMEEAEAAAFDRELEADAGLAERYRLFTLTVCGIRSSVETERPERRALLERLAEVDRELDRHGGGGWPGRWWLAAAAMMAVLLGLWWTLRPASPEELAGRFALPEAGLPVLMSEGGGRLDAIMNAYKTGAFQEASSLLEDGLSASPQNDTLQYYAGVVARELGRNGQASEHWKRVPEGSAFFERARYQLVVQDLGAGRMDSVRDRLEQLTDSQDALVAERARDLLLRLK